MEGGQVITVATHYQATILRMLCAGTRQAHIAAHFGVSRNAIAQSILKMRVRHLMPTQQALIDAAKSAGIAVDDDRLPKTMPAVSVLLDYAERIRLRRITRARVAGELGVSLATLARWIPPVGSKAGPLPGSQRAVAQQKIRRSHIREREAAKRAALRAELSLINIAAVAAGEA